MIFTLHSAKFGLNLTILMIYDSIKEGQWFIKHIASSYPKPPRQTSLPVYTFTPHQSKQLRETPPQPPTPWHNNKHLLKCAFSEALNIKVIIKDDRLYMKSSTPDACCEEGVFSKSNALLVVFISKSQSQTQHLEKLTHSPLG